jgi:acetylornithine deacetylase
VCEVLFDVRTTPAFTQSEVAEAIAAAVGGEVEVVSDRFHPTETPEGSRLLRAVLAVKPDAGPFASPTSSDWVFLREADGVKLGPGDSRLSHTPEERIELSEVEAGARLYADVAREYLR